MVGRAALSQLRSVIIAGACVGGGTPFRVTLIFYHLMNMVRYSAAPIKQFTADTPRIHCSNNTPLWYLSDTIERIP